MSSLKHLSPGSEIQLPQEKARVGMSTVTYNREGWELWQMLELSPMWPKSNFFLSPGDTGV